MPEAEQNSNKRRRRETNLGDCKSETIVSSQSHHASYPMLGCYGENEEERSSGQGLSHLQENWFPLSPMSPRSPSGPGRPRSPLGPRSPAGHLPDGADERFSESAAPLELFACVSSQNCDLCDEIHAATHRCLDCNVNMCETTRLKHSRAKISKDHNVEELQGPDDAPSMLTMRTDCSEHNLPFLFFDTTCVLPVCVNCVTAVKHQGHFHNPLSSAADELQEILSEQIQRTQGILSKLDGSVGRIQGLLSLLNARVDAARNDVVLKYSRVGGRVGGWVRG
jgi:hypothetical protein